jgi:colicin import membrane protein
MGDAADRDSHQAQGVAIMNAEPTELVIQEIILPQRVEDVGPAIRSEFEKIFERIKTEINAFTPDVSTDKGRKAIASMAHKIARTKTGLDDTAAKLVEDQKKVIDAVNVERRHMRSYLDDLKEQVRKPLTDWEQAEVARQKAIDDGFAVIEASSKVLVGATIESLRGKIEILRTMEIPAEVYREVAVDALARRDEAIANLETHIARMEKEQEEREELARLRAEAERHAAEERERARKEAEARIAEERKAVEAEQARIAAEQAQARAEAEAQRRIEQAEREAAERVAAAERAQKEAEERAARAAKEAEERAVRAAEEVKAAAAENERKRVAEQQEKAAKEARLSERLEETTEYFENFLDRTDAVSVVTAIHEGHVPHVTFNA